jgi:hypothetical protein
MGALVRMKPKTHGEMKVGKTAKAKRKTKKPEKKASFPHSTLTRAVVALVSEASKHILGRHQRRLSS